MTDYADILLNYKQLANERGIQGDTLYNRVIGHDDPLDAFRHAYTSGYITKFASAQVARQLGFAIEAKGVLVDKAAPNVVKMDLHNNKIGRELGQVADTTEKLADLVADAIKAGKTINHPETVDPFDNKEIPVPVPKPESLVEATKLDKMIKDLSHEDREEIKDLFKHLFVTEIDQVLRDMRFF